MVLMWLWEKWSGGQACQTSPKEDKRWMREPPTLGICLQFLTNELISSLQDPSTDP